MTDSVTGLPYATLGVPGRDLGLQLLLDREADGTGVVIALPYRVVGTDAAGNPIGNTFQAVNLHTRRHEGVAGPRPVDRADRGRPVHPPDRQERPGAGARVGRLRVPDRRDHDHVLPAAPAGWTRLAPDGRLAIVWRSDRYIDVEREFGRLLDQLVAARRPA